MASIEEAFKRIKNERRTGFIPYVMAGYPTLAASEEEALALAENGADIIEIGLPYSDPLADGATIQKASEVALSNGVTPADALLMAQRLKDRSAVPLVFMTYYNLIYTYGLERFVRDARGIIDGVIVPDLPPEEASEWLEASRGKLGTSFLLAPTSTPERIQLVAAKSEGFIYCVSLAGVTGARTQLPPDLNRFIRRVRKATPKPLAVGFGISTTAQAREVARLADGVIIGSALVELAGKAGPGKGVSAAVGRFAEEISAALRT